MVTNLKRRVLAGVIGFGAIVSTGRAGALPVEQKKRCEEALGMLRRVSTAILCAYGTDGAAALNEMLEFVLKQSDHIHVVTIDSQAGMAESPRICALLRIEGLVRERVRLSQGWG